jgi:hypothetical protein
MYLYSLKYVTFLKSHDALVSHNLHGIEKFLDTEISFPTQGSDVQSHADTMTMVVATSEDNVILLMGLPISKRNQT